jgi:GNAT superfamily N-acetyltransferase
MDIIAVDDPSDVQIREWHGVVAAAQACDHTDGPVQTLAETSARLLGCGVGCRYLLWAAIEDGMTGVASLRLPNEPGRAGEIDIQVRPDRRRRKIGSRLLAVAADGLRAGDCGSVISQVFAGAPAVPFLESQGFRCVLTMRELVLRMSDLRQDRLDGVLRPGPPGYDLVRWTGVVPDAFADGLAEAKVAMAELPAGQQMRWDADRVREMAEMVAERGDDLYTVAAVYGGHVAGFTEIVVPKATPARAAQYDTVVVPGHRGRRLGIWVKAAMLEWLRAERPEVTEIETDNADDNRHMLAVNEELGFRRHREYREYLAESADLPTAG